MGIFAKAFKEARNNTTFSLNSTNFLDFLKNDVAGNRLGEITYFRCLKILSESVAKLPLKLYKETKNGNEKVDHMLNYLLKTQPNEYYNANIFWGTVEYNRNHYGNSYVYIERYKIGRNAGQVKALWIMASDDVKILMDNKGIFGKTNALYYKYTDPQTHKDYLYTQGEVLHFKSWLTQGGNGIVGVSVQDILKNYVDKGLYSNDFITKMTKQGMISDKLIVQYTGSLDEKGEKALISHLENFSAHSSGKYITLPVGMTIQNLTSKLTDSQFLELNRYNSLQIASAFGIGPQMINDYEKGNFANAGVQMQMFYKDTLLAILTQYEQELKIKLLTPAQKKNGYYFNFNVDSILRGSFAERMETYTKAINNAILTPNECRALENRAKLEGGDELVANGNFMPIKDAGVQWKGGEQ